MSADLGKGTPFNAIYGLITGTSSTQYLVLVTKAILIGNIMGKKVFQIETVTFYPLVKNSKPNQIDPKDREG